MNSRWSGVSCVSSSKPVIAMTPFIGVRISWLMFARNSDFARAAASAAARAALSSRFARVNSRCNRLAASVEFTRARNSAMSNGFVT